jgi:hypothetical protein
MTEALNLDRAVKDNKNKPRLSLFPMRAFQLAGKVFTFGASKYAPYNWAKGLPHSELMDATLRHLTDYWAGEDNDPESGHSHLAHALCCVAMLLESKARGIGTDDRWSWTSASKPTCLHEGCKEPAVFLGKKSFAPFCQWHFAEHVNEWEFCGECYRWVKREHEIDPYCSQHHAAGENRDFLGGQHS